jgi:hypothetical protein
MLLLTKSERAEAVRNKVEICRHQSGVAALVWRQPPPPTHVAAKDRTRYQWRDLLSSVGDKAGSGGGGWQISVNWGAGS